jgi:hypothetical protein
VVFDPAERQLAFFYYTCLQLQSAMTIHSEGNSNHFNDFFASMAIRAVFFPFSRKIIDHSILDSSIPDLKADSGWLIILLTIKRRLFGTLHFPANYKDSIEKFVRLTLK